MLAYISVWKIEKYLSGVSKICVKISNMIVTNHGGSIWISVCTSHLVWTWDGDGPSRHIELMICPFYLFFFQAEERTRYFSVFYLSINAGSLISTFVTPMLRGWDLFWGPLYKLYSGLPEIHSRLLTVHLLLLYKFLILICLAQKKDYWIRCWEERRWLCL